MTTKVGLIAGLVIIFLLMPLSGCVVSKETYEKAQNELTQTRQEVDTAKTEITRLKYIVSEEQAKVGRLTQTVADLSREKQMLSGEIETLKGRMGEARNIASILNLSIKLEISSQSPTGRDVLELITKIGNIKDPIIKAKFDNLLTSVGSRYEGKASEDFALSLVEALERLLK